MYTIEILRDLHARTHSSLRKLMSHCRILEAGELDRELEGFAYPTVRLQLHHEIGAEQYWIGVLQGVIEVEEDVAFPTLDALAAYRDRVAAATAVSLDALDAAEIDTARPMKTWGGREQTLAPALVVLRVLTHYFNHQGQIQAMLRLLGKPAPAGLDLPLEPVP